MKHSRQYTGRSPLGSKGTVVVIPQSAQTTSVSFRPPPYPPPPSPLSDFRARRQAGHRFGSWNPLLEKNSWSFSVKTNVSPQSPQVKSRSSPIFSFPDGLSPHPDDETTASQREARTRCQECKGDWSALGLFMACQSVMIADPRGIARNSRRRGGFSLSPATFRNIQPGERVALPSPHPRGDMGVALFGCRQKGLPVRGGHQTLQRGSHGVHRPPRRAVRDGDSTEQAGGSAFPGMDPDARTGLGEGLGPVQTAEEKYFTEALTPWPFEYIM